MAVKDPFGEVEKIGRLGIGAKPEVAHYGPFKAFQEACHITGVIVQSTLDMRYRLFTSATAASQLHGPLGIAKLSAQVAGVSFLSLIKLAALNFCKHRLGKPFSDSAPRRRPPSVLCM